MDAGVREGKLVTVEVEAHGAAAPEVWTYVLTWENGKTLDTGKYVVWRRESPPSRIHRDSGNTSTPAPT